MPTYLGQVYFRYGSFLSQRLPLQHEFEWPTTTEGLVAQFGVISDVIAVVVAFVAVYFVGRYVPVRLRGSMVVRGFDETVTQLATKTPQATAFFVALALALGFAAQDIVAGVFILKDRPFEIGDWIEWGDVESGVVREIDLRVTKIETFNNELVTVPNSELADPYVGLESRILDRLPAKRKFRSVLGEHAKGVKRRFDAADVDMA